MPASTSRALWFAGAGDGVAHAVVLFSPHHETGYLRTACGRPSAQAGANVTITCKDCEAVVGPRPRVTAGT